MIIQAQKQKVEIKDKFIAHYKTLCQAGNVDYDTFLQTSLSFLRRSIRVNTLKITVETLKKRLQDQWKLTPILWCKEGFWIEHRNKERRDIGNLLEHTLGYIYLQEAASMIPPLILNPQPGEKVLDLCASPGSKTTQIAMHMQNKGILIANDIKGDRLKPLGINVQRCGVKNNIITLMQGQWFKKAELKFDRVLVDAPCSGTGTIRKSLKTLRIWNPVMLKRLAGTQKQLIATGFEKLKEGGTLVYSTCSLEPRENEAVVSWLLNNYENAVLEKAELKRLKTSPTITAFDDLSINEEVTKCIRIWPQDNDTEGFFVAKIRKAE